MAREQVADRAVGRGSGRAGARTSGTRSGPSASAVNSPRRLPGRLDAGLLDVVEAVGVGLPDVEDRAGQRGAVMAVPGR